MTDTQVRPPAGATGQVRERPALIDGWSIAIVVLSGVQPFARYLEVNADKMVHPGLVILDAVLWVVLTFAAFLGIRLLTRSTTAVSVAAGFTVFNLAFWNFFRWFPYEPESVARQWLALLIWGVGTAVAIRLAVLIGKLRYTRTFLVIFLGFWTAALLVSAVQQREARTGGDALEAPPAPTITFTQRPNVYWFLLDGHARSDELQSITGSDNHWFGDDLSDRGFSVSESSTSGYLQTHLSLTSTLAMDYVWTPGHQYRSEYELAEPAFAGDNNVVHTFEANGYRYVGAPDGKMEWSVCPDAAPNHSCIEPEGGLLSLREPHSFLVLATPIGSFGLPYTHNDLGSISAGIDQVRQADDSPFFLYAHVLSPHFPFRYESDCSQRRPWLDGYNYTLDERMAAYANDVQCLDHEMLATVDKIIADDPSAVIIIQSDHGSALTFRDGIALDEMTAGELHERYGALNAIRLPEGCRGDDIDGEPLVNTYRLVFACLGGQPPDLLPARHFYPATAGQQSVRSFVEVDLDGNEVR